MKLLHVINDLTTAGAEKLLVDILPYMVNKGYEVHVVISNGKKNSVAFERRLIESGVKIFNLNISIYNPWHIWKIIRLIQKHKYNIVHAHLFPTQYWVSIASLFIFQRTRFIKTEHSVLNERKQYNTLKPLERFIYAQYDYIIGITDEVTKNLQVWLSRKAGFVTIHNGVNLEEISEAHKNIDYGDYRFIESKNFNILMVGRFDGGFQKDHMTLVNAISLLGSTFHLYFAGQGQHEHEIKQEVEAMGLSQRVHFLGVRRDVYKLMKVVDLNVLSTNHEGLSGVALESMASGTPFIGSDVPGVREIVPSQKHLFPPKNPMKLMEKILHTASNDEFRNELIHEARLHVKKFDIKYMVEAYMNLYESN